MSSQVLVVIPLTSIAVTLVSVCPVRTSASHALTIVAAVSVVTDFIWIVNWDVGDALLLIVTHALTIIALYAKTDINM